MRKVFNKKGFTLVELLIVIAVLGIIAGIGVTSMGGVTNTFKQKADIETARQIASQIEYHYQAGNLTGATDNDDIDDYVTSYPKPQTGAAFNFAVAADGTVTVQVDTKTITSATEVIKISTSKVE